MTTIRTVKDKHNPYVMIDSRIFEHTTLSFKAKGILSFLLSKPDDWEIKLNNLIDASTEGRDSIKKGLKELREHGYMRIVKINGKSGRLGGTRLDIYEVPFGWKIDKKHVPRNVPPRDGKSVPRCSPRDGKSVSRTPYNITNNKNNQQTNKPRLEYNNPVEENNSGLLVGSYFNKLRNEYGMSTFEIDWMSKNFTPEYIKEKIYVVENSVSYKSGKIKNLARFFITALKRDYQAPKSSPRPNLAPSETIVTDTSDSDYEKYVFAVIWDKFKTLSADTKKDLKNTFLEDNKNNIFLTRSFDKHGFNTPIVRSCFVKYLQDIGHTVTKNLKTKQDFMNELSEPLEG